MKASFITALLAQAMIASASVKYCDYGTALASGNTCSGVAGASYCCANTQTSSKPVYRGSCFPPQNIRNAEETSQSCSGGVSTQSDTLSSLTSEANKIHALGRLLLRLSVTTVTTVRG
ncbi:hypothetical protein EYC84_004918 [Monilinia fructicola]|uniref:Hydrophobin n=1 Tax=Monilinia fructicola TaxID=38448 RepID=A0A5M9K1Z1_MONFR|nr:hypothetical protein EYC84_004918 [Monilinia fructicola]